MQQFNTNEEKATSEEWEPRGETVVSIFMNGTTGNPVVKIEVYDSEAKSWRSAGQFARNTLEPFSRIPATPKMRISVDGNTGRNRITVKAYD